MCAEFPFHRCKFANPYLNYGYEPVQIFLFENINQNVRAAINAPLARKNKARVWENKTYHISYFARLYWTYKHEN